MEANLIAHNVFAYSDLPTEDLDGDVEPAMEPDEIKELDDEPKKTREPDETRESEQTVDLAKAGENVEIAGQKEVDDKAVSRSVDS